MGISRIQFVDSISDTANVRLDLSAEPWRVLANGTDLQPPPLRRVTTSNFLDDGSSIPATVYDNRILTLALQLQARIPGDSSSGGGADFSKLATQHQLLNRELNRDGNILRWQPDSGYPALYFRTFRTPDYSANLDYGTGIHNFVVPLIAEPFGYGTVQSLGTFTVNNDPAAGSNPMYFDIAAGNVIGDVDTPLYISTAGALQGTTTLLATRRRGTPSNATWFVQAESMSQGTDTSTVAGGATFSGSSNNESTTTFSTGAAYANRLTATLPNATASTDIRGIYRVYARQKKSASGSSMVGTLRQASTIDNPEVSIPDTTAFHLNDYGLVQIPMGVNGIADGYGAALAAGGVSVDLRFARNSGSGSLLTDYVFMFPADTDFCTVSWPSSPAGPNFIYDGPNDEVYCRGTSPVNFAVSSGGSFPVYVGGMPEVTPNQANRVFFAILDGAVTASTALVVSYWPRYLTMRPVTT